MEAGGGERCTFSKFANLVGFDNAMTGGGFMFLGSCEGKERGCN